MNFIVVAGALSLAAAGMAAVAVAAEPLRAEPAPVESNLVERPGQRLLTVIEVQEEYDALEDSYRRLAEQAAAVGVESEDAPPENATADQLGKAVEALRERVEKAEDASTVAGVPRATLEGIASCESGGDPTAVSPDGRYRGKYQFTRATWRSLGGTGDPARATEAEQDRLAALLMERQGPSAWPVCSKR